MAAIPGDSLISNIDQQLGPLAMINALPRGVLTNDPPPKAIPYFSPGNPGRVGREMSVGTIQALPPASGKSSTPVSPYVFTMHYAPTNVSVSATADAGQALMRNSASSMSNVMVNGGAFGFSMFINREIEVMTNSSSTLAGPNLGTTFGQMGTMYDVEILYRVFNGPPQGINSAGDPSSGAAMQTPYKFSSMYLNALLPTLCKVYISPVLQFTGFISSIDITHLKYNVEMIPVYTTIDISFVSTGVNSSGTSALSTNLNNNAANPNGTS